MVYWDKLKFLIYRQTSAVGLTSLNFFSLVSSLVKQGWYPLLKRALKLEDKVFGALCPTSFTAHKMLVDHYAVCSHLSLTWGFQHQGNHKTKGQMVWDVIRTEGQSQGFPSYSSSEKEFYVHQHKTRVFFSFCKFTAFKTVFLYLFSDMISVTLHVGVGLPEVMHPASPCI